MCDISISKNVKANEKKYLYVSNDHKKIMINFKVEQLYYKINILIKSIQIKKKYSII